MQQHKQIKHSTATNFSFQGQRWMRKMKYAQFYLIDRSNRDTYMDRCHCVQSNTSENM